MKTSGWWPYPPQKQIVVILSVDFVTCSGMILLYPVEICHLNWFNKAGGIGRATKLRMMGKKKGRIRGSLANREKQDDNALVRKGTKSRS